MKYPESSDQDEGEIYLRLSAHRAMLGAVFPKLRSVSVEYRGFEIACRFILDVKPTEEEHELLSVAATEIVADYTSPYIISEEFLVMSYPEDMNFLRHLIYLRYETSLPENFFKASVRLLRRCARP